MKHTAGVAGELVTDRLNQTVFVVVTAIVGLGYSLLLPFSFTQRFSWHSWNYLDARFIAFSAGFGLAMGWLVTAQIYALRHAVSRRGAVVGSGGAVLGVLPSVLCCTPVIPSLLAFIGLSGVGLAHTSGRIQSFFANNQNLILGISLGLVILAAVWATRRIVHGVCLDGTCEPPPLDARATTQPASCCSESAERSEPREEAGIRP